MKNTELMQELAKHNQQQVLQFWDELDENDRKELIGDIGQLDFNEVDKWIRECVINPVSCPIPEHFGPAPYYPALPGPGQEELYEKACKTGRELISAGKVAAFVVAGGQGTRLGFDGPKGNFKISPVKSKTLFQLFAEMILAASRKYGRELPWYIMTSPLNHAETVGTFESAGYFGLKKENVFIFIQGTMPNFSLDGKILLAEKSRLAVSPDGHGGSLKALYKSGAAADMRKRGVEFISYFQVDNPLINIFDELFIGLHALAGAQMSSKALIKTGPREKVGNFCQVGGRVTVIEYSERPDNLADQKNADGSLVFQLGSIAIHIINRDFVEQLNSHGFALPLHRAVKKIPYIDTNTGQRVEPAEPNGVKLETFVFDALPLAEKSIILETIRSEEFGPVKNATGVDSAQTSRHMMIERAGAWLEFAGVVVPKRADCTISATVEISPLFALTKEDLKDKLKSIPTIKPADTVYLG
jgi:UDP-N-acetylglucosamine/UDP-N-acetylgalactosamine diphosphorylase